MATFPRSTLLENLRRAGYHEAAVALASELPDPVDLDEYRPLLERHGVTRGELEEAFGASP